METSCGDLGVCFFPHLPNIQATPKLFQERSAEAIFTSYYMDKDVADQPCYLAQLQNVDSLQRKTKVKQF